MLVLSLFGAYSLARSLSLVALARARAPRKRCLCFHLRGPWLPQVVITFMKGVHRFTLDDSIGEFVYMGPVTFPAVPKTIYSCNEGNYQLWDAKIQAAVEMFKNPPDGSKPYSAR